jgi:threonine/homoserine/homoserine lactone efflux protein
MTWDNLLLALVTGYVCGFVVSVPVGPVNLTVINKALQKGFQRAFLVGLGAASAETIYATVLMAGHTAILNIPAVRDGMRLAAVLVIVAVGIRSMLYKPEKLEASEATIEKVDERWHHPRAFMLGFLLTIFNLLLVVLWATLSAVLFAREWVLPPLASRTMCALGVFLGCSSWFLLLAYFVSHAHRRVRPETLAKWVRVCGVVFVGFAGLLAYKLFRH